MRPAALTLLFVAFTFAASTQITFLPQLGFENSRTQVSYNDLASFLPRGNQLSPKLGLRVDYKFKKGHGPFVGVSTSQSSLYYTFNDPETGMNNFDAMRGNLQLQFEGGYQLSTKRIYLGKSGAANNAMQRSAQPKKSYQPSNKNSYTKSSSDSYRGRCGQSSARNQYSEKANKAQSVATSRCGEKSNKTQSVASKASNKCGEKSNKTQSVASKASNKCGEKSNKIQSVTPKTDRWFVRIQPSAGLAFIPSPEGNISIKELPGQTPIYQYKAGNWNTAFITGAAFEFGQNVQSKFTVSINYLKGLGNLDSRTITTINGIKPTVTTIESEVSSWNFAVGIPFSFNKKSSSFNKKSSAKQKSEKKNSESRCGGKYKIRSL